MGKFKGFITSIIVCIMLIPQIALSEPLGPPWKCIAKSDSYEFWFDTSTVHNTPTHIGVRTWELREGGSAIQRHEIYDKKTKKVMIGFVESFKHGNRVGMYNMSQAGYNNPSKIDKKLYKIISAYKERPLTNDAFSDYVRSENKVKK